MNNHIWLDKKFYVPDFVRVQDNLSGKCFIGRTKEGKAVYVYKEGFKNLPEIVRAAFKYLSEYSFKCFYKLTLSPENASLHIHRIKWSLISHERRAGNLRVLLSEDILGVVASFLDKSTKVSFASASHALKRNVREVNYRKICSHAAFDGNLALLIWARSKGAPWDEMTCAKAALGGHLEVLKWARKNDAIWDSLTCASAAWGGHLEVLKWARANGAEWDEWTCAYAARGGHLEVLKWSRANGAAWDKWVCSNAAGRGHLEMLKWARANGVPWDRWACVRAADEGHLEVLKWAWENGAEWDEAAIREASFNNAEITAWLDRVKKRP